ncbi:Prefoldin subunit 5 [Perkinsus olseni]|uniref:Prefoldin subunit 5 n=1 Tax=Perkinsus olseni TaxID=32597 RepID=A0A7J6SXE9_PEROL|nr:Prefoldin subunit 5 [Perkinsus olseni]
MSAATSSSAPSTVNPTQLSLPELNQHKQRLEQEVGQLTDTLTKLRVAQQAYDMSARALGGVSADKDEGKETLVPLSNSVYVRGKACEVDRVLLNVGTGYFVEKPTAAAQKHCEDRSGMINGNIGSLAKVLGEKRQNLEMCMAVMQQKMAAQQQQQQQQPAQ